MIVASIVTYNSGTLGTQRLIFIFKYLFPFYFQCSLQIHKCLIASHVLSPYGTEVKALCDSVKVRPATFLEEGKEEEEEEKDGDMARCGSTHL